MATSRITVEGLNELLRKIRADGTGVYADAWRRMMGNAINVVWLRSRLRAPRNRGDLANSLTKEMQAIPVPMWAAVSTNQTALGGRKGKPFRYPWALESSKRIQYRYHGTSVPTRHWMSGALTTSRKLIDAMVDRCAREIEATWGA